MVLPTPAASLGPPRRNQPWHGDFRRHAVLDGYLMGVPDPGRSAAFRPTVPVAQSPR